MTKDDAIAFMEKGGTVKHRFFSSGEWGDEWMKITGNRFEFEDGCMCSFREFWAHRTDDYWNDGWSEYVT